MSCTCFFVDYSLLVRYASRVLGAVVQRWCSNEWGEAHNARRERRWMMQGPSHHQDSRSLDKYAEAWVNTLFNLV
jgi:hypothetical protein